VTLRIRGPGRIITGEIAAKSLRRAKQAIRVAGADKIALSPQGYLAAGDVIAEAGLSAQPKRPTPR
jgi:predicted O-methyltransferase YrrM